MANNKESYPYQNINPEEKGSKQPVQILTFRLNPEETSFHRPIEAEWFLKPESQEFPMPEKKFFSAICHQATFAGDQFIITTSQEAISPEKVSKEKLTSILINAGIEETVAEKMSETTELGKFYSKVSLMIGPNNAFIALVEHPEGKRSQPSHIPYKIKITNCSLPPKS